jgi:signal transduction histidine kinase
MSLNHGHRGFLPRHVCVRCIEVKSVACSGFAVRCYWIDVDLATFIDTERAAIVAEWEAFARTLLPAARNMTAVALRDHADEILSAIVRDMKSHQTPSEQSAKGRGQGEGRYLEEVGQLHARLRLDGGFKLGQVVAEYRALRASVLRLWESRDTDPAGLMRFNESIDAALTEAVDCFANTTDHYRDQTLGILGHDLRNPLSAIITGSSMLIGSETLDDRTVRIAARMLTSAERMKRMINDLLDLTRTRFGDLIPVVRAPMDLYASCQQVVAELEGLRPSGGLRLTRSDVDLRGDWDADRLAQLLSNLVRNAIDHGGKDEPIDIAVDANQDEVLLEVHNGGPRIPENAFASIFEPMVRHDQREHAKKGLGLGLYIARQIAVAHGGTLDVSSNDVTGTTFKVRLPRRTQSPGQPVTRG